MVIGYVFYGKLKLYSKRRFYEISLSHLNENYKFITCSLTIYIIKYYNISYYILCTGYYK